MIIQPTIETDQSLAEGGTHFTAEQVSIQAIPHFWERRLDLKLTFEKPDIQVAKVFFDLQQNIMEPLSILGVIDLHVQSKMEQGKLTLCDHKKTASLFQIIYFKLDAEFDHALRGHLVASLDDPLLEKNCVVLSLAEMEPRHLAIDFNFDEVECTSILGAVSSFLPVLQGLTVNEGVFKGKMALTVPQEGPIYAQGELTVHNLSFDVPELEMRGKIKEARIHLDENHDPRAKISESGHKKKLPRTIGHLEFIEEGMLSL